MIMDEISGSLVIRDKKILMTFNEETETWEVPSGVRERGELSADAAERVTTEVTGCDSVTVRYKGKLKKTFERKGEEVVWQPYRVELEGDPSNCQWVPMKTLGSKKLAAPLDEVRDKLTRLN